MGKHYTLYKTVDVDVDIYDVIEYIENCTNESDLQLIRRAINSSSAQDALFINSRMEGTLNYDMKMELLANACKKFTLAELEQRLGNKFELI
jgi:hypothetical protein